MCDTIAIVKKDRVFFAKNSDRDPNEAQVLDWQPRRSYDRGARIKCTHIEIPQADETHAVVLSRPFWTWGAEMGVNEHHVAIGNEAVFTKQPYAKSGLTGMDLVRLALERSNSAERACEVIVQLLRDHGQGGGCGLEKPGFTYHNSFMVADPSAAFVLETAGREYAIEKVQGLRAISNILTIPEFAAKHADGLRARLSRGGVRCHRMIALGGRTLGPLHLFAALRDHGFRQTTPAYSRMHGTMQSICMHGGGMLYTAQTTASWVSELSKAGSSHWVTATAAPCTSLFKPVKVGDPMDLGNPTEKADDSLWWRHERFHRAVIRNPEALRDLYIPERNAIEAGWIENPPEPREAFAVGDALLEKWTLATRSQAVPDRRPSWVQKYWAKRSAMAGLHS
ncbi:MAG: peptidase U34 [Candidatus Hydrogenedentes bacterium]|nr:peptidase U34 [Candidatus Hydrogenedentota bacterium]